MCGLSTILHALDIVVLLVLDGFIGAYLWPITSTFHFSTDLAVVAPYLSFVGTALALVFTGLVLFCSNRRECGFVLAALTLVNIVAYSLLMAKGNISAICDGASSVADQVGASMNCSTTWMKYSIYALLVISLLLQAVVAIAAVGCLSLGAGAASAASLGKRSTASTLKSLGRRRLSRPDKGKWKAVAVADEEHELGAAEEYPIRAGRSKRDGVSDSDSSLALSDDDGPWEASESIKSKSKLVQPA